MVLNTKIQIYKCNNLLLLVGCIYMVFEEGLYKQKYKNSFTTLYFNNEHNTNKLIQNNRLNKQWDKQ